MYQTLDSWNHADETGVGEEWMLCSVVLFIVPLLAASHVRRSRQRRMPLLSTVAHRTDILTTGGLLRLQASCWLTGSTSRGLWRMGRAGCSAVST